MASQPAVQWTEIERILSAQPGAQVPFGRYIVNLGPVQGSVIKIAPGGRQAIDRLRPRPKPPQVLPCRIAGFVDRGPEQRVIGETLARGQVVDVHGAGGTGKTSLLSQVMHAQFAGDFAGMLYLTARHDTAEDLLQEIVEHFYEAEGRHVKVTEDEARRLMAGKQALIVLDEAHHLAEGEAEAIAQAMPQAAFVIAGREPQVRQGRAVPLAGLPDEEALILFERHLGRPLADERPAADALCRALGRVPLAVVKAARTAALRRVPLAQMLHEVQSKAPGSSPVEQLFWMLGRHLSAGERRVLGALAAPGGPSVSLSALAHISAVAPPRLEESLLRLQGLGLLQVEGDRCSLDNALRPFLRRYAVDDTMLARAAGYYLQQAGKLRVSSRHPDEENVIAALAYHAERGRWREVLSIVRGMEVYLVTSGRWGQWRKRLENAWHAARELGDPRTEAWAQNQLAVIALAEGDRRRAVHLFRGALRLWRTIGDRTGETIARWNLQALLGSPPPPDGREPAPKRAGRVVLPAMLGVTLALLLVLAALLWLVNSRGGAPATTLAATAAASTPAGARDAFPVTAAALIAPTSAPPTVTTAAPPVATTAPPVSTTAALELAPITPAPPLPRLEVWLLDGCDRSYLAGEEVEIRAQSNAAGVLDVHVRDPGGRRQRLLRVELPAGGLSRARYIVPEPAGAWRLEAELDGGRATAACAFAVVVRPTPAPPSIEGLDSRPATGEPTFPGDAAWILARIGSRPGLRAVAITTRAPGEQESRAEMEPVDDLTYRFPVAAYEEPGLVGDGRQGALH